MELKSKQTRYLRGLAHHLNPLVHVGKAGVSPATVKEVDRNLADHELIKVRISCDDRAALVEVTDTLANETQAAVVQVIGHTAIFYRRAEEPTINLPRC